MQERRLEYLVALQAATQLLLAKEKMPSPGA
jgi:hypothetical protein